MAKLTILFSAMDSFGHVNCCLGLAEELKNRGHRIVFALKNSWEPLIKKHSLEFIGFDELDPKTSKGELKEKEETKKDDGPNKYMVEFVKSNLKNYRKTPLENMMDNENLDSFAGFFYQMQLMDEPLGRIIKLLNPDVIMTDIMCLLPSIVKSNIPWINIWSPNPIILYGPNAPPHGTGFPTDGPRELWDSYRELAKNKYRNSNQALKKWYQENGIENAREELFFVESPYLNVYVYPEDLDYCDLAPTPKTWFRMDALIRKPDENSSFQIPEKLANKTGKLIYFSLGSMGSVDLELMRNVIRVLSKTPYRIIVSKGPLHDQLELPDNMWGDRYVNQMAILPHVDLVIAHGGNNTLTESLFYGKPAIILPIYFDQLDNAQRLHEKKLGIRLDTYRFTDEELLNAVETALNDKELRTRVEEVSEKIRVSKTHDKVCELIEKLAKTKKCPI